MHRPCGTVGADQLGVDIEVADRLLEIDDATRNTLSDMIRTTTEMYDPDAVFALLAGT